MIEVFLTFLKIGLIAFGGGYGAIGLIQDEVVQIHHWFTQQEFLDFLSIAQMTPGPIGLNTSTFIGYKLYGFVGALLATTGFILPSILWVYVLLKTLKLITRFIDEKRLIGALKGAALVLILVATYRIGSASIINLSSTLIFACAFLLLIFLKRLSPIWIILGGGLAGILLNAF
ncbi:chromate transporter [Kosmotoga arenicorallina S304]|uniref:Chromate transporter n=1 Tax=Kosmotoga arenicorallina S304 TaxID=1453497 RepID=A0A176JVH1_9BACT|nr:chromate transporter [Kosmotoga arenicorallina]OAA27588.1 chromate transporter [Kosmotoga arenicorallina S304]